MITTAYGYTFRTADELNLQHYINLAKEQVGKTYDLKFQSSGKWGEKAGEFEILSFEEKDAGWMLNQAYLSNGQEIINGAKLGIFTIQLHGTKFYSEKIMRFEVEAYVQDKNGTNDHLFIYNTNKDTGKRLKAYEFPILNWNMQEMEN